MIIRIIKILKDTLEQDSNVHVSLSNTTSMTISHYADSAKSTEATIPFEIEGSDRFVPYIDDIEFCTVIRKKINLTATGTNEKVITDIGKDEGEYDYKDNVPPCPLDLPPGFQEIYKK